MPRYDTLVIGSGQAGNPLCQKLADHGWTVALIEKDHLGGTCVNTGCTPTKTMIASAQVAHYARDAARWGVQAENVRVELPKVLARKNEIVESMRSGWEKTFAADDKLRLYRGSARFVGPKRVQVNGETIEAQRIFIDTGTRPAIPQMEGLDQVPYLTNVE